ncbi:MAG: carbon-nitrogen hydrolase family protein [Anaerolineae bacterium]|jgi:predicted amidohydrolase|nr:MAG: carbon-nitrogen hydrolase family protein [Anaerolineae bacterium]MCL4877806.1 carbon-nitrogen hydrolase family protein [Anaerolineae bacterium]
MREVTIAIVQFSPKLGEPEENLVKMSEFVSKIASQQKVDLIVFPELATSGYELGVKSTEVAQRIPGPTVNLMSQRASEYGVHIAFGMVSKEKVESIIFNSAVLIGPDGELVGSYDKMHLRGEERMAFREGYKLPVFETETIGTVGMLLGWDLAFPETARSLALDGAELVISMTNWETAQMEEYRSYVKSRAFENSVFMVVSNRVGEDVTLSFGGESMIVGPRGKVYSSLDEKTDGKPNEGFSVARIDLDEVRKYREEFQYLQARQPTNYKSVVKRY